MTIYCDFWRKTWFPSLVTCSNVCDFMVYVLNSLFCKFCWHKINFYSGMMELLLPSHFGNGWWNSSLTWSSLDWSREQELTDKLTIFWQSSVSGLERLWYQHSISWPVLSFEGTWRQLDLLKLSVQPALRSTRNQVNPLSGQPPLRSTHLLVNQL